MEFLVIVAVIAVIVWWLSSRDATPESRPTVAVGPEPNLFPNPAVTRSGETVAVTVFGRSNEISSGTEGKIYEIPLHRLIDVEGQMLFKRLTESDHDVRAQFEALNAFLAARPNSAREHLVASTAWPLQLVVDGGIPIGFVMRRAPEQYRILVTGPKGQRETLADMPYLASDESYLRKRHISPLPSQDDRIAVLGELAAVLAILHEGGAVYGDLSLVNAAYSIRPAGVFLLDCDSIRVPGSPTLKHLHAHDYIPPEEGSPTTASDVYKFGCLVQDVLSQPYHAPSEVHKRRRAVERLPAPGGQLLLERSLGADPAHRPLIREWADLLQSRSPAPPRPSPPPPPPPRPPRTPMPPPSTTDRGSEVVGWTKDAQGRWVRAGSGSASSASDQSSQMEPPSAGWIRDPVTGEWHPRGADE